MERISRQGRSGKNKESGRRDEEDQEKTKESGRQGGEGREKEKREIIF